MACKTDQTLAKTLKSCGFLDLQVLLENQHYFVVKSATYKSFENKKTKRGELYWDIETREKLDKDRFRQGLGDVVESYQIMAKRLGVI